MRWPLHRTTTAEADLAIRDLTDDRVDGREYKHPTVGPLGKVDVLDIAWDDALLAVVDDDSWH